MNWLVALLDLNLAAFCYAFVSLGASIHAVQTKKDSNAALIWIVLIWSSPFFGALIYGLIGISRLSLHPFAQKFYKTSLEAEDLEIPKNGELSDQLVPQLSSKRVSKLCKTIGRFNESKLYIQQNVSILENGEEAYGALLQAIAAAKKSIYIQSYIFDSDSVGKKIAQLLVKKAEQGLQVYVLVDGVGARYSFPTIFYYFRGSKVQRTSFFPTFLPWRWPYMNYRNHRKLWLIDNHVAFTGGINIRKAHMAQSRPKRKVTYDLQFQVEGEIVGDFIRCFEFDWNRSSRVKVDLGIYENKASAATESSKLAALRVFKDGPDNKSSRTRTAFLSTLFLAKDSIQIMTPYFVPDQTLISALSIAALIGKKVQIYLPYKSNLSLVDWASRALLGPLLDRGVEIYFTKGKFYHSKILLVDKEFAFVGSSNWDMRSFRLNFEFNIEAYSPELSKSLRLYLEQVKSESLKLKRENFEKKNFFKRLRNNAAKLCMPYL